MATTVTVEVVLTDGRSRGAVDGALTRALDWFSVVETTCSRFLATSELQSVCREIGRPVQASPLLCQAVGLAIAAAEASGGAFDPTVGDVMARRGFDRSHTTGACAAHGDSSTVATYRDVSVDLEGHTITIHRPLVLDLGALAKGLAVDLAAEELRRFEHFAVNAGGDLRVGGLNVDREPWTVGIRHPREDGALIETTRVSNEAVCTSGDYERRGAGDEGHHLIDPRTGRPASDLASVTVRAPTAVSADLLATTAFVLGPVAGLAFLEREGVGALLFTPDLDRLATSTW